MISFEYMPAFWLLPLPFLIYRFAPGFLSKQTAVRVPFFHAMVYSLGLTPKSGARELKASRWQKISIGLGWIMLVLAAAKPIWLMEPQTFERAGRDLMIIVDLSGSMAIEDYMNGEGKPQSRLATAKRVLTEFSQARQGDRLGLILFGDSAFLQAPFTIDHIVWRELLNQTEVAMAGESTHLGDAIGLGIKTFVEEESDVSERVMIVLTDGNDTDSLVPPIDAAKVAAAHNIRIHTIAMGSPNSTGEEAMDIDVIEKVAQLTGGESFMASSTEKLTEVYGLLDEVEVKKFESFTYQQHESLHFVPILVMFLFHLSFMTVASYKHHLRGKSLATYIRGTK